MAQVMHARGARYAVLINADDGLDELSLGTPSTLHTITPDGVSVSRLDAPGELERYASAASLRGGDTAENVAVVHRFLAGEPGPVHDVACANAGLALIVAGRATTLREGFALAEESVASGRAGVALERLVALSNS